MRILHAGFDGLDVSFRGNLPYRQLEMLALAKQAAIQGHGEVEIDLAPNLPALMYETGAKGGYAFRLDTGEEGETWFIKNSTKEDWNFRVSVKSAALLKYGYEGVRDRLYERLEAMGATVLEESIGRADFAIDFLAPEFALDPFAFVTHARAKRGVHAEQNREIDTESADMKITMNGQRVLSVTIGKMPGRQVIVYDKGREVSDKGKNYWWKAWGLEKAAGHKVWRVEVRAGKKYLKERLGITTWQELEANIGDAFVNTMQKVRMRDMESGEQNVTRAPLHPMWLKAKQMLMKRFDETLQGQPSVRVIQEERRKMRGMFHKLVVGTVVSYGAVRQIKEADYGEFVDSLAQEIKTALRTEPHRFIQKYAQANGRYMHLRDTIPPKSPPINPLKGTWKTSIGNASEALQCGY